MCTHIWDLNQNQIAFSLQCIRTTYIHIHLSNRTYHPKRWPSSETVMWLLSFIIQWKSFVYFLPFDSQKRMKRSFRCMGFHLIFLDLLKLRNWNEENNYKVLFFLSFNYQPIEREWFTLIRIVSSFDWSSHAKSIRWKYFIEFKKKWRINKNKHLISIWTHNGHGMGSTPADFYSAIRVLSIFVWKNRRHSSV